MATEMIERWAPVPGYEGLYSVSDHGRLRSEPRRCKWHGTITRNVAGKILRVTTLPSGYLQADLRRDNKAAHHYVHRLVLRAFVREPVAKEEACHNDGNRANNALSNLRWDTRSGNHQDKNAHGTMQRGESHARAKLTEADIRAIRRDPRSLTQIGAAYGISWGHAGHVKRGGAWGWLK